MIICAAIKIEQENKEPIIITGFRHSDCFEILYKLNPELSIKVRKENLYTEGFLTNDNTFVNRREAFIIARQCGQLSTQALYDKSIRGENILWSEDLY